MPPAARAPATGSPWHERAGGAQPSRQPTRRFDPRPAGTSEDATQLQLQPAAGGETSAPATVSPPGEQSLAVAEVPEPQPSRTVDQAEADAGGSALMPPLWIRARRAVAQLLDAAARGAEKACLRCTSRRISDARVILRARKSRPGFRSRARRATTLQPHAGARRGLLVPNRSDLGSGPATPAASSDPRRRGPGAARRDGAVEREVSLDPPSLVAALALTRARAARPDGPCRIVRQRSDDGLRLRPSVVDAGRPGRPGTTMVALSEIPRHRTHAVVSVPAAGRRDGGRRRADRRAVDDQHRHGRRRGDGRAR